MTLPKRVILELTSRCDLQCLHCAGAMHERRRGDMDYAFFRRTALHLRSLGIDQLGLSYLGEPFLCRWLPDVIRHAKHDLGFRFVGLTTNGRTATPLRVRDCIEAGLDELEFEYNSAGPDQFHYVTGAPERDFWKVDVNLLAARIVRDEIEEATGHRCTLVASSVRFDAEQPRRMQASLRRIAESADAHRWREPRAARPPCRALFERAHITFDGRLSACPYEHAARFEMGDLTCETFLEAWEGERFARLRTAHLAADLAGTPCEDCAA
jgi:hypothetical protein